jgi:hypothetical protein
MIIQLARRPGTSFSGHALRGSKLVRYIYMDEAGTSVGEPVTVVAGVIVHGDTQWKPMEQHLLDVKERHIPAEHLAEFVIHGKDILNGRKAPFFGDNKEWPADRRMQIIKDVLQIRSGLGFSVCLGYSFRESSKESDTKEAAHFRHVLSYCNCLIGCEEFMRRFAQDEVATVVAEDIPEKRRAIKETHSRIVAPNTDFPALRESLPIRHIVDDVHFADPKRSSLLQFADAYAFSFRRILAGYGYAEGLAQAIEGPLQMVGEMQTQGQAGYKILYSSLEEVSESALRL